MATTPAPPREVSRTATRPGIVLAILCSAAFMASLDVFIVNVAFDDIGRDFGGANLSDLSWILNAYTIFYAALLVPAGRIADRFGRKGTFLLGVGLFTIASAAGAMAQGVWWLVGFRVVQAIGAALLTPSSLGLVLAAAPPIHRVRNVRIWAASGAVAAALGPVIGGLLVEASWRWVFVVNVPIGIVAILMTMRFVPPSRDENVTRLPDVVGAVLLILCIGALTLGFVEGPDWGWTDPRIYGAWAVTVVALAGFLASSRRHAAPVIDPALIRVRAFAWANVTALLFCVPFAAVLLSNILWLQQAWGYSAIRTGVAVAVGPLMVPLFNMVAHRLGERVPVGYLVAAGCLLYSVGSIYTALVVTVHPNYVTSMLPSMLIGGAGVGLALPTILSSATADLPPTQSATGSAVVNMSRQIGTVLGVCILVAVLGTPASAHAAYDVFRHAWWALAAVGILGALVAPRMTPRSAGTASPTTTNAGSMSGEPVG